MSVLEHRLNLATGTGDLAPLDSELPVSDDPMPALIYRTLFTNARASVEEVRQAGLIESNLGGHWADGFYDKSFGSKLWLLVREANSPATWAKAKNYCEDSLSHLIGEYARSIVIDTGFRAAAQMYITVKYERADGTRNTVNEVFSFAA